MNNTKDLMAKLIVFITAGGIVGSLGYAFFMGGWKAFLVFIMALGIVVVGIGFGVLIIWAFRRVFVED